MTTSNKNVIYELNKGLKLNDYNYGIWSLKIQYVLEVEETLEAITCVMKELDADTITIDVNMLSTLTGKREIVLLVSLC